MTLYCHAIDPERSPEHKEAFDSGRKFGVWRQDTPAPHIEDYLVFIGSKEEFEIAKDHLNALFPS